MKVDNVNLNEKDIENIRISVKERKPVDFFCYTLTPEQKDRFLKILSVFLKECNQLHLYNYLSYCLFELLDNASKANAKRIFFKDHNLDINNETDYENGMKDFKKTLIDNGQYYQDRLEAGELRVHLLLSADDVITVTVTNNTKITDSEFKRIQEKIQKTKLFQTFADAVSDIDQTEGSGLGIITVLVMLKKLGLDAKNLKFITSDNETIATIEIPKDSLEEI
ncbi:MAG: hypothetical protein J6X84_03525 [Treponema sp.]|nr:hypothetical protein [Treponema sp.]